MNCQKQLFRLKENEHYLNCAYKAPVLKSAEAASTEASARKRNPVDITTETWFEEMPLVRAYFAELINADAKQIGIVPSASYGFSSVLTNTRAKSKGHAITIDDAFPSGYMALESWCNQNSNDLIIAKPSKSKSLGNSWNRNILEQINEQTSVVLLSSVHWSNGIKFDLEKIGNRCKEVGAKFLVDGTQSVGALEMDIKKYHIDALVCAGYKWLLGPYSMALTYYSEAYKDAALAGEAWLSRKDPSLVNPRGHSEKEYRKAATGYDGDESSHFVLMPILRESLRQLVYWNPQNIQQYCAQLIKPLVEYIDSLGERLEEEAFFCNHVFALPVPPKINIATLKENLTENNVQLSVRDRTLRVSVNVYNDQEDIDKLIYVIDSTLNTKH